jgi:hypothetical protein
MGIDAGVLTGSRPVEQELSRQPAAAAPVVEDPIVERRGEIVEKPASERRVEFLRCRWAHEVTEFNRWERQIERRRVLGVLHALRAGDRLDNTMTLALAVIHAQCLHDHSV